MKTALTEQQIAAMAASGVVVTAGAPAAAAAPVATTTPTAATTETNTEAAAAAAAATPEAVAAAAAVAAPVTPTAADANVVTYLQAQVAGKDKDLLEANVKMAGLTAKVADFEASLTGLLQIAAKSVNNMRVALGGSATDMTAMNATQILAQHAATAKEFESKFVAGGVAAVDAAQASKATGEDQIDSLTLARLNAVRGPQAK